MNIKKFEDLDVWKTAIEVAKNVYRITSRRPFNADFPLRDQIRRSAISISSNIAEGFEKNSNKDFARFLKIAKGSSGELRSQIILAKELGYITENEFVTLKHDLVTLSRRIQGLISYLQNRT